jgi:hypothetical protein
LKRAVLAASTVGVGVIAVRSDLGADYGNIGCHLNAPRCDEASFPIHALAHLRIAEFMHEQPLMGPVSLVLRAPFVAVANLFDANLVTVYRVGVFACLFALALLAVMLVARSLAQGHAWVHTAVIGVVAVINPLVTSAIDQGHPEEAVAGAAGIAAALWAIDRRCNLAAVALALAIATKAWALLLVVPIALMVDPSARRQFATVVAIGLLCLYVPLSLGDTERFRQVTEAAGQLGSVPGQVTPANAWFFTAHPGTFSRPVAVDHGQLVYADARGYAVSVPVARLAHALVLILGLALTIAWYRRAGPSDPATLLLVLAAILLMRCILDPGNHSYYHLPAALALLGWEAVRRPRARFPWLAALFIASVWAIAKVKPHLDSDTAFAWVYLGVEVPMCALIVGLALNPCRRSRSTPRTPPSPTSPRHATV